VRLWVELAERRVNDVGHNEVMKTTNLQREAPTAARRGRSGTMRAATPAASTAQVDQAHACARPRMMPAGSRGRACTANPIRCSEQLQPNALSFGPVVEQVADKRQKVPGRPGGQVLTVPPTAARARRTALDQREDAPHRRRPAWRSRTDPGPRALSATAWDPSRCMRYLRITAGKRPGRGSNLRCQAGR
jgi:hypothetical protein